jgi:hypothetical protein
MSTWFDLSSQQLQTSNSCETVRRHRVSSGTVIESTAGACNTNILIDSNISPVVKASQQEQTRAMAFNTCYSAERVNLEQKMWVCMRCVCSKGLHVCGGCKSARRHQVTDLIHLSVYMLLARIALLAELFITACQMGLIAHLQLSMDSA